MMYKYLIIKMVLTMQNEDYLCKTYHYLLAKYRREKGAMSKEQSAEYAEQLKRSAKELIDCIGTETEEEQGIVTLIYDFIRSGFLESRSGKCDVSAWGWQV